MEEHTDKQEILQIISDLDVPDNIRNDQRFRDYLDELKKSITNDCYRSAIIMLWNLFMYVIYNKIGSYGLSDFLSLAKQKKIKFHDDGEISNVHDLNKISDSDLLMLCHKIGLYDRNVKKDLGRLSHWRSISAHITQPVPNKYKVYDFIKTIDDYLRLIKDITPILVVDVNNLNYMSVDEIKKYIETTEFNTLKDIFSKVLEDISYISSRSDIEDNDNLFNFLYLAIVKRSKVLEQLELFDELYKVYKSTSTRFSLLGNRLYEVIRDICKGSIQIRKHIVKKNYLDDFVFEFKHSASYMDAGSNVDILLDFVNQLNEIQIKNIADATIHNDQIYKSFEARPKVTSILSRYKDKLDVDLIKKLEEKKIKVD